MRLTIYSTRARIAAFVPLSLREKADGKRLKKKLKRSGLLAFFANYPASIIGIEACRSAHHWVKELTKLGHDVILLNTRFVKNYVVGNKTDFLG